MEESIFFDDVRSLFALIDRGIYNLIALFYNTLMEIANMEIIQATELDEFATRIYGFIGIVMFFKVSFSLINYIVNPDSMSDKTSGAGNLIKKILIVFVLIIIVPFCFDFLYDTQSAILEDNVIPKLILGVSSSGETTDYSDKKLKIQIDPDYCVDDAGKKIYAKAEGVADFVALATFRPFFQIDDSHTANDFTRIKKKYCQKSASSVSKLLKSEIVYNAPHKTGSSTHVYVVDYNIIVSTIVGIVVALLFLSFCFDAATRTIKLLFLEIIAPVAIISYVEPNSSKNGIFSKWLNEVKNTWLSLFIRLAAVFFGIYIITMFNKVAGSSIWVTIFVIIGALIFAKQLPKLIESMLGIKVDGGLQLNPFKKVENEALGMKGFSTLPGKVGAAAGGAALAATGAAIGHYRAKKAFNEKQGAIDKKLSEADSAKRRIEEAKTRELQNARFTSDYDAAIQRYNRRMEQYEAQYGGNYRRDLYEQRSKNEKEYYDKFSNRHAIAAGFMETFRGTRMGFQKGGKNPSEVISNSVSAAKGAAKEKNDHDIFTIKRRMDDFVSDIAGIKNESGTTSIYKKEIKTTNEELKDISNFLDQINHTISGVREKAPQAITITKDGDGHNVMRTVDNFDYEGVLNMTRGQLDSVISQYESLRADEKAANKRLAELNESLTLNKDK